MKSPWLSAILNFFFMGLGYLYIGNRKLLGVALTLCAAGFTYLEQVYIFSDGNKLQAHDPTAFAILFVCVFVANTVLAIDAFQEAKRTT